MFEYTITDEGSYRRVTAQGRIDALSASEIQKVFHELILEGGRVLLADLAGVHYISSAGLRTFMVAQKELKKVGGEILLSGLTPQVFDIFKVSGFDQFFRIVSGKNDVGALTGASAETAAWRRIRTDEVSLDYIEKEVPAGSLFLIGSTEKLENAAYGDKDVVAVPASRMCSGCGLAALGDSFQEYQTLFGEAMVINGNFFYYPAVRHPSVDFMLDAHSDPAATYKFLHGFGSTGEARYLLSFKSEAGGIDLAALVNTFLTVSRTGLIGITMLAESKGVWGMNIKKSPVAALYPTLSESIFSNCAFPDWFDFPVEAAYAGSVVAVTGIASRNPQTLPNPLRALFSGGNSFHLHGGIFDKAPIGNNVLDFDAELTRVVNELDVFKIQHLLGQTRLAGGMAGIVEIEV